jgi:hypothetical protein
MHRRPHSLFSINLLQTHQTNQTFQLTHTRLTNNQPISQDEVHRRRYHPRRFRRRRRPHRLQDHRRVGLDDNLATTAADN